MRYDRIRPIGKRAVLDRFLNVKMNLVINML